MSKASTPRAVIHKRILDIARDEPDASIEQIASEVSGATPDLVDRVLDDYGDPAEPKYMTQPDVSVDSLTDRQCEILRTILRNPDASQRTLAGYLGITAPTVSRHLNKIPDWDWDRRLDFAKAVVDEDEESAAEESPDEDVGDAEPVGEEPVDQESTANRDEPATDGEAPADGVTADENAESGDTEIEAAEPASTEVAETVIISTDGAGTDGVSTDVAKTDQGTLERLDERISGLEQRFTKTDTELVVDEPVLVQKIVHVCMDAETITEDEELRIIRALLT